MTTDSCSNCQHQQKSLWAIGPPYPDFKTVETTLFLALVKCVDCGRLWLEGFYEPFAAFRYAVKWPFDEAAFKKLKNEHSDNLYQWHEAEVRSLASSADEKTLTYIQAHYDRSRGYVNLLPSYKPNPIELHL